MARSVRTHGLPGPVLRWEQLREQIHHDVVTHAFDAGRNTFTQAYGSAALDASLLLIPRVGFLPATDPRVLGTIAAVRRELSEDGLVRRYQTTETDDGLKGSEGLFIACSFWLVDALGASGQRRDAIDLFERLLLLRNDVGLLSEEWDPAAQRQLGNTPQAFSHFALVVSALQLHMGRAARSDNPMSDMTAGPQTVIDRITLIVSDLDRAEEDYVTTFGCCVEQRGDIEPSLTGVLCIRQARGRRSLLRLGRERIELLEFTDSAGRPYPPDSTSTDLWFQHMAIVVSDMTDAYQRVMANRRLRPISRNGPVRLPDSSGGVTAFKFRDHDGHPLELFAFPEGRVPAAWRTANGTGSFLGVDHTAIAISDTASSTRFFGSVFGFSAGTRTENRGPEQADLDDVEDVHVSVTQLAPDLPAPRLELLRYHVGTRRPIPPDTASNDIVATHSCAASRVAGRNSRGARTLRHARDR